MLKIKHFFLFLFSPEFRQKCYESWKAELKELDRRIAYADYGLGFQGQAINRIPYGHPEWGKLYTTRESLLARKVSLQGKLKLSWWFS